MELKELRKDSIILDWLYSFDRKNTAESCLQSMKQFIEFTNKTPEELISESEHEIQTGVRLSRRSVKHYLTGFKKHLQDQNAAEYTIKNRLGGVKSFFQYYDIEVPRARRSSSRPHTKTENLRIPNKEELQQALKVAEPIEKAILLVGISSGLSASDICNLKVSDFKEGYDPESGITTLYIRRTKTKVDFVTFLTPEASNAVIDYLNYRNREPKTRKTEKMIALRKQRTTEDSYLFIKQLVSPEYDITKNEELRKLSGPLIIQMYRSLSEKAGKNTDLNNWNFIRSHTARKYFNNSLIHAGADSFLSEYLLGHKLNQTQEAYFQAQPDKLKELYKKYVPYLTISPDLDFSESDEFKKLKSENELLIKEAVRATVERQEIQELKQELQLVQIAISKMNPETLSSFIAKVKENSKD